MEPLQVRRAEFGDCRAIAELYRLASEGVSDYIWSTLAQPGEDLLDVGERRYQRRDTTFSYQNCTVLSGLGNPKSVAAMLFAYPLLVDPEYVETDPIMKPYAVLEEDRSYYLSGLAVFESFRRRGLATRLLELAEQQALHLGLSKISLIAFAANTPALNLYSRHGYQEVMRHKIVPHPLIKAEGDALLLVKQL